MSIKRSLKYLFLLSLSAGVMQNSVAQQSTPASIQKGIGNIFSNSDENELLEPEQAFKSKLTAKAPETLVVDLVPAKGYYLYKDKIRFALSDTKGVLIRKVMLPKGEIKMDATFGKMEVYRYPIQAIITLDRMATTKTVTVVTSYQGCHEKTGVCYPPVVTSASVALPGS